MINLSLSTMQVCDLIKLVVAKQKTVKPYGDRPYWINIENKLRNSLNTEWEKENKILQETLSR